MTELATDAVTTERQVATGLLPEPVTLPPSVLESITRTELDVQIRTARAFPRSLALFRQRVLSMIRLDAETARSCYYALPRRQRQEDGSYKRVTITGPSVRLEEMVAAAYGNLRRGARSVGETADSVVAQGYAHDLESNNAVVTEIYRRIVTADGRRYPEDVVTLTRNAACAIARRNATYAVIPRSLIEPLVEIAKKVAAGDAKTLTEGRTRALAAFADLGVPAERVLAKLERAGVEDLDLEDIGLLHGLLNAIRDQETTVAAEFPAPAPEKPAAKASERLTDTVRRRRAGRQQPAPDVPSSASGAGAPPHPGPAGAGELPLSPAPAPPDKDAKPC
jgi:hypothetical protein